MCSAVVSTHSQLEVIWSFERHQVACKFSAFQNWKQSVQDLILFSWSPVTDQFLLENAATIFGLLLKCCPQTCKFEMWSVVTTFSDDKMIRAQVFDQSPLL